MMKYMITLHKGWSIFIPLFLLLQVYCIYPVHANPAAMKKPVILQAASDEVIIKFKSEIIFNDNLKTGVTALDSLNSLYGLRAAELLFEPDPDYPQLANIYKLMFPVRYNPGKLSTEFQKLPIIHFAEPNYYYTPDGRTGDAELSDQPGDFKRNKDRPKAKNNDDDTIIIGLIDTGIDTNHFQYPDFIREDGADNSGEVDESDDRQHDSEDIIAGKNDCRFDTTGHGTHIANVMCQILDSELESEQFGDHCKIMDICVGCLNKEGKLVFNSDMCAQAILYACNDGADILNLSWSSPHKSCLLELVINTAVSQNCLIIASAGNDNRQIPYYPAAFENVLAVAAIDNNGKKYNFSNFGEWVDIAAIGASTFPDEAENKWYTKKGTSISAARVTCLAAKLLSQDKHISADSLKKKLIWSTDNIASVNPEYEGMLGVGKINEKRALNNNYQPNILFNEIELTKSIDNSSYVAGSDSVYLSIHIKNIAYDAKNINVSITSDTNFIHISGSDNIYYPELGYETSDICSFNIYIKDKEQLEWNSPLALSITTESGFEKSKKIPISAIKGFYEFISDNAKDNLKEGTVADEPDSDNTNTFEEQSFYIDSTIVAIDSLAIEFWPENDTTLFFDDSLVFFVNVQDSAADSLSYQWYVNGLNVINELDSIFIYSATNHNSTIDTVLLELTDLRKDTTVFYRRLVSKIELTSLHVIEPQFFPGKDTTITPGDTLNFHFSLSYKPDSAWINWFVNNDSVKGFHDSVFTYIAESFPGGQDTVMVAIHDILVDSSFINTWIVSLSGISKEPLQFYYEPSPDTTLNYGDSLQLAVMHNYSSYDSLNYGWFINSEAVKFESDSIFTYTATSFTEKVDTVKVNISGIDNDSLFRHEWRILTIPSPVYRLFRYYPMRDTTIEKGDSLIFRVDRINTKSDSIIYEWGLNGALIEDNSDSTYTYSMAADDDGLDTLVVRLINFATDSSIINVWLIQEQIKVNNAPTLVSYHPGRDTTVTYGDSLLFSVSVKDSDADSIFYKWLINDTSVTVSRDSVFRYYASENDSTEDSVFVVISDADTSIIQKWIIHTRPYVDILPAPHIIYPRNEDTVCDNDKLIWDIDSLGSTGDSTIYYTFEVAADSSFLDVLCSETCENDTSYEFSNIPNVSNLKVTGGKYYWHVKARTNALRESNFSAVQEFRYYPLYVELASFTATWENENEIRLEWETTYEFNNAGFNLYRSTSMEGGYVKINNAIITGEDSYDYLDQDTRPGQAYYYRLEDVSNRGTTKYLQTISVDVNLPEEFKLFQNYPNPFNNITLFKYQVPIKSRVTIDIYNVLGRKIHTLVDAEKEPGFYVASWDGIDNTGEPVVSGIYFYHLHSATYKSTRKMTIVR